MIQIAPKEVSQDSVKFETDKTTGVTLAAIVPVNGDLFKFFYRTKGNHETSFYDRISQLREEGLEIATARDAALIYIKAGNPLFNFEGFMIAENPNYLPDGRILITSKDYNPLLGNKGLTKTGDSFGPHGNLLSRIILLTEESKKRLEDIAEEDKTKEPQERRVLAIQGGQNEGYIYIPYSEFDSNEITLFLFKDLAREFSNYLKERYLPQYDSFGIHWLRSGLSDGSYSLPEPYPFAFHVKDLFGEIGPLLLGSLDIMGVKNINVHIPTKPFLCFLH